MWLVLHASLIWASPAAGNVLLIISLFFLSARNGYSDIMFNILVQDQVGGTPKCVGCLRRGSTPLNGNFALDNYIVSS